MKHLLLALLITFSLTGISQTIIITPTTGASSQSIQAIQTNTLTKMFVAMTSTPGIYVTITGGTINITPVITPLVSGPSSVTTSGTIAAGAKSIVLETSGDFTGSIDGLRFLSNGFLSYDGGSNNTLPAIPYIVTTGTLYIRKLN